jgi:outer membrane cobalamin receptor
VKFTGFDRKVDNMIVWLRTFPTPTVERWQPENIGSANVRGYEGEASFRLSPVATLDVNYTYTNPIDLTTGDKIPFIPKQQWKGSLSIGVAERTNLYIEGRSTENYVMPGDPVWHYSVMDLKVVERLASSKRYGGQMFVSLTNVFDRKYEVAQNYPMPPKELKGGVTITF